AVVAASALAGYISGGDDVINTATPKFSFRSRPSAAPVSSAVEIISGFPTTVRARSILIRKDDLNTDGIYAGKWTYKDDLTPQQMAEVIFENYDASFRAIAKPGDIIVAGRNFGTGSSREQAATALKYFGIPCVIAASFSETY